MIAILSMMVAMASLAFTPRLLFNNTERSAQQFMRTLKMALNASAESSQRYAVVLDFDEQMYALMPFNDAGQRPDPRRAAGPDDGAVSRGFSAQLCPL